MDNDQQKCKKEDDPKRIICIKKTTKKKSKCKTTKTIQNGIWPKKI